MNANAGVRAIRIATASHAAFAGVMIGLGILGLLKRDLTAPFGPVADGAPGRTALIYLCALVPLVCGVGLVLSRTAAGAARVLLAFLVLWLLAVRVPYFALVSSSVDGWYSWCETAVMTAGAWVLFTFLATDADRRRLGFAAGAGGVRVARALYGFPLILFGIAHFMYLENTAPLVPAWLPWHVGWAYLTGATFVLAGLAVLTGVWARLAAALSVWQMGLFALLVWAPRAFAGALSEFQWGEFVTTVALVSAGWVVTDSYRGVPWTASRSRPSR